VRARLGGAARLAPGKPCEQPDPDLASGHTGGTFYIRARDRAGACVPAVSETLVHRTGYGWLRGWPLGLFLRSPQAMWAADPRRCLAVGQRPSATHPTSGVGAEGKA